MKIIPSLYVLLATAVIGSLSAVYADDSGAAPAETPQLQLQVPHRRTVLSVAFSPDGSTIASQSMDETLKLWDAHTGELQRTLPGYVFGMPPRSFFRATANC